MDLGWPSRLSTLTMDVEGGEDRQTGSKTDEMLEPP